MTATPDRKRRRRRLVLGTIVGLFLIVAGTIAALPYLAETPVGTRAIAEFASARLGGPVAIARLEVGWWRPHVVVHGLRVGDGLALDTLVVDLDAGDLRRRTLSGRITIEGLVLDLTRLPRASAAEEPDLSPPAEPWRLGNLVVSIRSRTPDVDVDLEAADRARSLSAIVRNFDLPGVATLEHVAIEATTTLPADLGNLATWNGQLSVRTSPTGTARLVIFEHVVTEPDLELTVTDGALALTSTHAVIDGRPLSVSRARLADGALSFAAEVDERMAATVELTGLPAPTTIADMTGLAGADLRAMAAKINGTLDARLAEQTTAAGTLRDLSLEARITAGELELVAVRALLDGLPIEARGTLAPLATPMRAHLEVSTSGTLVPSIVTGVSLAAPRLVVDLDALAWPVDPATLPFRARLEAATVDVLDAGVEALAITAGRSSGSVISFTLENATLAPDLQASGTGEIDPALGPSSLRAQVTTTPIDLPLVGRLPVSASLRLDERNAIIVDEFTLPESPRAASITGRGRLDPTTGTGRFELATGWIEPIEELEPCYEVAAVVDLDRLSPIEGRVRATIGTFSVLEHHVSTLDARGVFSVTGARIDAAEALVNGERASGSGQLEWSDPEVFATAFELTLTRFTHADANLEDVTLAGTHRLARDSTGTLDLQVTTRLLTWRDGLAEGVSARGLATHDLRVLTVTQGAVTARRAEFSGTVLEELDATGDLTVDRHHAEGLLVGTSAQRLVLKATRGSSAELAFSGVLLPAHLTAGHLIVTDGRVTALGGEQRLDLDLNLANVDLPARLRLVGARLDIAGAELGGVEFDATFARLAGVSRIADLSGDGRMSFSTLRTAGLELGRSTAPFTLSQGKLQALGASWQRARPSVQADLELDLLTSPLVTVARITSPEIELASRPWRDLVCNATLRGDRIDIAGLAAKTGAVDMRGGGWIAWAPDGTASLNLSIALEHPEIRGITATTALTGVDLTRVEQPRASGTVSLSARELDLLGDVLTALKLSATGSGGRFTTTALEATWGAGKVSGTGTLDTTGLTPSYTLNLAGDRIPVHQRMTGALGFVLPIFSGKETSITGNLDARVELAGRGWTRKDLDQHLRGTGTAVIANGRLTNSPVIGYFMGWHGPVGETNFTADTAFAVGNGKVATTRDVRVKARDDLLTMHGSVDFDRRVAYEGQVKALGNDILATYAPYLQLLSKKGYLPFRVTGTLEDPVVEVLALEAAVESLLDPESILEQLFERTKPR